MTRIGRKEIIDLARAYVEQCKVSDEIENYLDVRGIKFCYESNRLMIGVENIFNHLHKDLVDILYDFLENGFITVSDEENQKYRLYTIEDVVKEVLDWK